MTLLGTALLLNGISMSICGSSRPASGSEHRLNFLPWHGYVRLAEFGFGGAQLRQRRGGDGAPPSNSNCHLANLLADPFGLSVSFPSRRRPSLIPNWLGSHIARFEACSAFTSYSGLCTR